jgi:hypothetical protein
VGNPQYKILGTWEGGPCNQKLGCPNIIVEITQFHQGAAIFAMCSMMTPIVEYEFLGWYVIPGEVMKM